MKKIMIILLIGLSTHLTFAQTNSGMADTSSSMYIPNETVSDIQADYLETINKAFSEIDSAALVAADILAKRSLVYTDAARALEKKRVECEPGSLESIDYALQIYEYYRLADLLLQTSIDLQNSLSK